MSFTSRSKPNCCEKRVIWAVEPRMAARWPSSRLHARSTSSQGAPQTACEWQQNSGGTDASLRSKPQEFADMHPPALAG